MSAGSPLIPNQSVGSPIGIYFTGAIRAARKMQLEYNEQFRDPETGKLQLKHCVRKEHIQLLEVLMRMLGKKAFINRCTGELPELSVTRGYLAKKLDCSEKTIYNLMTRLHESKMITKTFRSKLFSLKIEIHSDLLITKKRITTAALEAEQQNIQLDEAETALTTLLLEKSLPNNIHTLKQEKLLSIKDVDSLKSTTLDANHGNESDFSKTLKQAVKHLDLKTPEGSGKGSEKTTPVARTPLSDAFLNEEMDKIHTQVTQLWTFAHYRLYKNYDFMAASQIIHAMTYFAKGLFQCKDAVAREKKASEMMLRLEMAGNWMDKKSVAFIPLPTKYFNVNNPKGFPTTHVWLTKTDKLPQLQEDMKRKSRMFQHIQKDILEVYQNTDFFNIGSYQHAVGKIEAYQPDLVQGFLKYHINQLQSNSPS
jgi:hypothetical protein